MTTNKGIAYGHRGTTYNEGHDYQQDRVIAGDYQFIQDHKGRWALPGGGAVSYIELFRMITDMGLTPRDRRVTVYRSELVE